MSGFEVTAAEQVTLNNHNRLIHQWQPGSQENDRLRYIPDGIEIYHDQLEDLYQEDLVTLIIHFEDLGALLTKRVNAISHPETMGVHDLYQLGQLYQGLRVLLAQSDELLHPKCETLIAKAQATLHHLDAADQIIVQNLVIDLISEMSNYAKLQLKIATNQKSATFDTKLVYGLVTTPAGQPLPFSYVAPITTNKEIVIADVERAQCRIEITVKLQCNFSLILPLTRPTFTDLSRFLFYKDGERLPIAMLAYPKWPSFTTTPKAMKVSDFQACPEGAEQYFRSKAKIESSGVLTYQAPQLAALITGNYVADTFLGDLPYFFQAMVEIAKHYHCYDIALYIPNDFIVKAYAYGFYSVDKEVQELCENVVQEQFAKREPVPLLAADTNAFEDDEELLSPVFFAVGESGNRPIYLSEKGVKTTYDNLCQQPLFNSDPILPNPYGMLTRPFCSVYDALIKRERGHPIPTRVGSFETISSDINWIKQDEDLIGLGEASHLQPDNKSRALRVLR